MKNFLFFLDINKPVQTSIIIYIIFIVIYIIFFNKQYKDKKYILPIIVITLSILIFYISKLLQLYFS
jgi:hypothetical protein